MSVNLIKDNKSRMKTRSELNNAIHALIGHFWLSPFSCIRSGGSSAQRLDISLTGRQLERSGLINSTKWLSVFYNEQSLLTGHLCEMNFA
jgi:hypothetical protein